MAAPHALLLTDIVDSTRLTERLGEPSASALWAAHDRLARDLIPPWRGHEIDKTDGMLVLFESVDDAVGYALAYHRGLREHGLDILARAGIHAGVVTLRPNAEQDVARGAKPVEVEGLALPIAARVMSVAGGGQTLLTTEAREALGSARDLHSHGHWSLKGVSRPMELFEVVEPGKPFAAPADTDKAYRVVRQGETWQPLRELRHSLPAERDAFVGQVALLATLEAKLESSARLITVLGIGGVGKTRLTVRFAWTQRAGWPGGVWFCDLSQARGLEALLFAVARGLEVPLGGDDPIAQLGQAIAGRGPCLVVLDNFEQVASLAEATLGRWLERAPQARFIATSREVLGIVGEEILTVPPLAADDAAELFVRRAAAARHGYTPSAADRQAIGQLVGVLDGLPLAIELAAARVRVVTPSTLLTRMRNRFDVLLSRVGRRDRQATLRATFDWSWELLSDAERSSLARLSVFRGSFTLQSAAHVLGVDAASGAPAADMVQQLVDKSFVRQIDDERFDLLESVREYAAEHLRTEGRFAASGPACEADTRARHWRYFASLDENAAASGRGAALGDLAAACRAAAKQGDGSSAIRCLITAWTALRLTGPYRAGVDLAVDLDKTGGLDDRQRAWVHWVAGDALDILGDVGSARSHVERGLQLARQAPDPTCTARLLIVRGSRQGLDGDPDAAFASVDEALRLSEAQQDLAGQAAALLVLGRLMEHRSRFGESRRYYERALALARDRADLRSEGGVLGNLGGIHHALGELEQARSHYERALAIAASIGDRRWEGNGRCNLGLLYQEQGRREDARLQFDSALATARQIGHVRLEHVVLCNIGILLAGEGRLAEAADHLAQAVAGAAASSDHRAEGQARGYLGLVLARRGALEAARSMARRGEELLVAAGDSLSEALLLCDCADIELLTGDRTAAQAALERAATIADALQCGPDSELRRRLAAIDTEASVR